jgi:hypothetical protein
MKENSPFQGMARMGYINSRPYPIIALDFQLQLNPSEKHKMASNISEKLITLNLDDDSDTSPPKLTKPTKPTKSKPTPSTSSKASLPKEAAAIESRGFHRHGACSWYDAELVMLEMALALLGSGKEVAACFPHRDPATVRSCIQRTTNPKSTGWLLPEGAEREEIVRKSRELKNRAGMGGGSGREEDDDVEIERVVGGVSGDGDEYGDSDEDKWP